MYSRSPSRSNRSKGIKVKHILQVCLLVAVCFWLIYQVKHSHEKKKEFDEKDAKLASDNTESGNEIIRLGRKDISRATEIGTDDKLNGEDDDENEADQGENRHEDDEQEREESRSEDREEEEDTAKGGEDDENDKGGEERSDEENHEEEFVDEEKDKEVESDEKNEDNDDGEKENNEESEAVLEDRDQEVGARNTHEAREEHYKADDASSEVAHDTSIAHDTDNATLNHTNASSELIIDGKENVSHPILGGNSHEPIEGTNSSDSRVLGIIEHKDNLTESIDQAQVSNNLTQIESEQSTNITQAQNATSGDTSGLASDKNQSDIVTVTNSTEPANTTSVESLGSSTEVKLPIAENITIDNPGSISENNVTSGGSENAISNTANDDLDSDLHEHVDTSNDDLGSDLHEHGDIANDDLGADLHDDRVDTANDETDAELHEHDDRIDTANEMGAELHDHDDDFASTLAQEEKEYRTDTGTLPDIKVEVENAEDIEAE